MQPLLDTAEKAQTIMEDLFEQAATDPELMAQLLANPGSAYLDCTGEPLPSDLYVRIAPNGDLSEASWQPLPVM